MYGTQRLVYALAALRSGAERAEVAYCFLERPGEPVTAEYTAADQGALEAELLSWPPAWPRAGSSRRPGPTAVCARTARAARRCAPGAKSTRSQSRPSTNSPGPR